MGGEGGARFDSGQEAWEQNGIGGRSWGEVWEKWKLWEMGPEGVENRNLKKCLGVFFQRRGIKHTRF